MIKFCNKKCEQDKYMQLKYNCILHIIINNNNRKNKTKKNIYVCGVLIEEFSQLEKTLITTIKCDAKYMENTND